MFTLFVSRILPTTTPLLRLVPKHSTRRFTVNISRSICSSKSVDKYLQHKDQHINVYASGFSFSVNVKDVMEFFSNVNMVEEPHMIIVKSVYGDRFTGSVLLKVADLESLIMCLEKKGEIFRGSKPMRIEKVNKIEADAYLGKNVLKIINIPYDWGWLEVTRMITETMLISIKKIYNVLVPRSAVGNKSNGRAYIVFYDQEMKELATKTLNGLTLQNSKGKPFTLEVFDSHLLHGIIDSGLQSEKVMKFSQFSQF